MDPMEETTFDPSRRLCPDGNCVGVLDAEGRCSVCGLPEGAEAVAAAAERAPVEPEGNRATTTGGFDPGRRLCDDGSCVGVVGPDGVCGTCGRKAD